MAGLHYKSAGCWENKFRTPSSEDLLNSLIKPQAALVEVARQRLREIPGVREELRWQGLPWRWTFAFVGDEPSRALVYIVPEPGKPKLVLPVTIEELAKFPVRKLTKPARDPLAHGVEVDGVHWVEWELSSRALLDEVLGLVVAVRSAPLSAAG